MFGFKLSNEVIDIIEEEAFIELDELWSPLLLGDKGDSNPVIFELE